MNFMVGLLTGITLGWIGFSAAYAFALNSYMEESDTMDHVNLKAKP